MASVDVSPKCHIMYEFSSLLKSLILERDILGQGNSRRGGEQGPGGECSPSGISGVIHTISLPPLLHVVALHGSSDLAG